MTRYCGRDFTPKEFEQIRCLIKQNSEFTRMRLSKEVCRILQWLKPDGKLKVHGGCAAVNRGVDCVQLLVPSLRA